MSSYWPWWAGAAGLALVALNHTLTTDTSFGISSAWDRVIHWREERSMEKLNEEFLDQRVLAEALATATAEQFGSSTATLPDRPHDMAFEPAQPEATATVPRQTPLVAQAALLVSVFLGGLIAAFTSGRFKIRFDMGPGFRDIVTPNPLTMVAVLFAGGVLVGFGTRLAGGCSSGHGLSGCGRLRPVSMVATAVFFGTAVGVSFLLWKVI